MISIFTHNTNGFALFFTLSIALLIMLTFGLYIRTNTIYDDHDLYKAIKIRYAFFFSIFITYIAYSIFSVALGAFVGFSFRAFSFLLMVPITSLALYILSREFQTCEDISPLKFQLFTMIFAISLFSYISLEFFSFPRYTISNDFYKLVSTNKFSEISVSGSIADAITGSNLVSTPVNVDKNNISNDIFFIPVVIHENGRDIKEVIANDSGSIIITNVDNSNVYGAFVQGFHITLFHLVGVLTNDQKTRLMALGRMEYDIVH